MTKVLFILDDLSGGGAERVFVNIANGFAANNILVEFLVGEKKGAYLDILNSSIPLIEVGGTSLLKYLTAFPRIFRQNNYTHVFTASHYASSAAIISKKITRTAARIYLTHHYSLPASRPQQYVKGDIILKSIHFFITPYADKIIAVSKGSLAWLRKFSHNKLKQGIFIYNPVYDESIYSLATEHVEFPVDIKDKIVLLNVGRLTEQKDHETLIKAFSIFKQTHQNAILFILGTGPLQSVLENHIQKNNLSSCIFLMGFQSNPYKWMAKCDLFILSSIYEGFGNVIVEAMALGKTVVSTNCPSGPAEILMDGTLGYLSPVQNPAELSKSIERALQKPFDSNVLIHSTYQYTIKETVKKYIEIL